MSIIMKPKPINNIVAKFFIKTIPTISGETYYKSINNIIQALYTNATTLPKIMVGRKHSYKGLTTKVTLYTTLEMVTQWKEPKYLDMIPVIPEKAAVAHCQQDNDTNG